MIAVFDGPSYRSPNKALPLVMGNAKAWELVTVFFVAFVLGVVFGVFGSVAFVCDPIQSLGGHGNGNGDDANNDKASVRFR